MTIHIGCCGFPVARVRYYERFSLVEVQKTFYRPPRFETVQRWREQAPADFEFTLKAWQLITYQPRSPTYRKAKLHITPEQARRYGSFRPTEEVQIAWATTRQVATILGARIVVFQCPPSFTPTEEHIADMTRFFSTIERDDLLFAWEPRRQWEDELVSGLCRDLDMIHCVDPFRHLPLHGEPAYFRLHGIRGYRYLYTQKDLTWLLKTCMQRPEVCCLFNNAQMWQSAQQFQALLSQRKPGSDCTLRT